MTARNFRGTRALVIGAGVGGILAAGALRRHFREVVVVEKDVFPSQATFRKGVPQGPHGHLVLKRGENIAEAFFPGFRESLIAAGGIELGMGRDMGRYSFGKWSKPVRSDIMLLSQTRPLLEHVIDGPGRIPGFCKIAPRFGDLRSNRQRAARRQAAAFQDFRIVLATL